MARNNDSNASQPGREGVISIIGPGMRVIGDCETQGTLRVEGTVEGTVRAGKAVVVGKDGVVDGDILTQDAVVGGRVTGSIGAESRLELQATCVVEGEIQARRIKLDEGGTVNGTVRIGETRATKASGRPAGSAPTPKSDADTEAQKAEKPQEAGASSPEKTPAQGD
ncbi:MAG TPA: polymer-forming cytoskeletal protein [Longimicrobiales bacterium]|nr:polymer-forming cytoskeletal protein [Longimicrobiales bacterium]